ncbi:MAG: hypothetical protein ABJP48_09415 [Erythrobacter sp.]
MSNDMEKRDELRAKIDASERRNAQRSIAEEAREAASAAGEFIKKHPGAAIGGAVATGVAIGLMTKPGRRVAAGAAKGVASGVHKGATSARTGAVNGVKRQRDKVASLLGDAALAYGVKVIDNALNAARRGQDHAEDFADASAAKTREIRREATYIAGSTADATRTMSKRASRKAERTVRELKNRVTR